MARVLHPAYFPAERDVTFFGGDCSYWGGFDIPLEKKMEAYWRVRKWSIDISATFNEGESTTGASGILDVSSRGNEANLVCPGAVVKFLNPIGEMIYAPVIIDEIGFIFDAFSFDDIVLRWPDDTGSNVPVTFKIGQYQIQTFATIFNGTGIVDSSTGLVEAIEWWPYEDAQGNALYDTATGEPLSD